MLTGATSKDETNSIYAQLRDMAEGEVPSSREIKLLYVTVSLLHFFIRCHFWRAMLYKYEF